MTLIELLVVSAILLMMAGTMATLAMGVQNASEYQQRQGLSLQHGQVILQRITMALNDAHANNLFPGCLVFAETVGGQTYPDTLVIWHPSGTAATPDGLPKMNELLVYCPNPNSPNELWEIQLPNDLRSAPPPTNTAEWLSELKNMRSSNTANRVVVTNLLRVAGAADDSSVASRRGVLRFNAMLRPSATELQQYQSGSLAWDDLSWMQGIRCSQAGLRQSWCCIEFQLRPGDSTNDHPESAIPFFGSAAVVYEHHKP